MDYERFASLIVPHTAAMARVAAALVGMADAEDAAQEALLRAWQHWPSLRKGEAARAWLLRITVNVCYNWQAGRFGTARRLNEPLGISTLGSASGGHDSESHDGESVALRQAILALPDELRRVVALRFYAGMNSTEVGEALDVPAATVRTRLRRALQLLRKELADDDACVHSRASQREGVSND